MLRKVVCALFALVLCVGVSLAAEHKGKIKSVDADKNTITLTDKDGNDHTITVDADTKFLDSKGKAVEGGLKASAVKKAGTPVTITTEKKDGKDVVTQVKLSS